MNPLLGPEEQKRLVDGLLSEANMLRHSAETQLVNLFGTKYGGSYLKESLSSAAYSVKTFFLTEWGGSRIDGLFNSVSSAVKSALSK